jgi:hypothetical protein
MTSEKFANKRQADDMVRIYREGKPQLAECNKEQVELYLKQGDKYKFRTRGG